MRVVKNGCKGKLPPNIIPLVPLHWYIGESFELKRATYMKGLIWPPLKQITESCFSPISSNWFIRIKRKCKRLVFISSIPLL